MVVNAVEGAGPGLGEDSWEGGVRDALPELVTPECGPCGAAGEQSRPGLQSAPGFLVCSVW